MALKMIHTLIRELRQKRGLTVQQLADLAGFSKGLISQIENEITAPTIPTLRKIASAFGLSLSELFFMLENPEGKIVTGTIQAETDDENANEIVPLIDPLESRGFMPSLIRLASGKNNNFEARYGKEFWYVIEGKLEVKIGPRKVELAKNNYLLFSTVLPFKVLNIGPDPALILRISSISD